MEQNEEVSAAIARLKIAIPYILIALETGKKEGTAGIAVTSKKPDGTGRLVVQLSQGSEFISDVAIACGISLEPTEKQKQDAAALEFLDKHNLRKI